MLGLLLRSCGLRELFSHGVRGHELLYSMHGGRVLCLYHRHVRVWIRPRLVLWGQLHSLRQRAVVRHWRNLVRSIKLRLVDQLHRRQYIRKYRRECVAGSSVQRLRYLCRWETRSLGMQYRERHRELQRLCPRSVSVRRIGLSHKLHSLRHWAVPGFDWPEQLRGPYRCVLSWGRGDHHAEC